MIAAIPHEWIPSTLGHGHLMCKKCFVTILEAQAIGTLKGCNIKPKWEKSDADKADD